MGVDFEYDFSSLSADSLSKMKTNFVEIRSVFDNPKSNVEDVPAYHYSEFIYYLIGFSSKMRFLCIYFDYQTYKIRILDVYLPNETEIQQKYCKAL